MSAQLESSVAAASGQHSEFQILLGEQTTRPRLGFGQGPAATTAGDLVTYSGNAHLCTVAPTRSGKGTGVIVPNLLSYPGPVVVFDPKGENYQVTARRRRELGHTVIKLDPFGVIDDHSDGLNPLDLFELPGMDVESESQALAELLSRGIVGQKEPFWDISGTAFSSGLLSLAATQEDPEQRNVPHICDHLSSSDTVYSLAVVLDAIGDRLSRHARGEIASVLQMPDVTRGGVMATAKTYFKPFGTERVQATLKASTFSLQEIVDGAPLSVYLILPPHRVYSHRGLLKMWIGTLLSAIFTRHSQPPLRTLFLLDEVAQLETFPLLSALITLSAGYGVTVHTFWQDLAQIKSCYPRDWKTILNNCAVVQTFGIYNRDMASQWGDYLDHGPDQLRSLQQDEQILSIHGQGEHRCRRLNYLTDSRFAGQFDDNPLYGSLTRRTVAPSTRDTPRPRGH